MKNTIRNVAVPTLLTLAFLTTSAWAQTPAPSASSRTSSTVSTAAGHSDKRQEFIEKRLSDLHSQLKITAQQTPQWDAFAQTMRDSAQNTEEAYRDRAEKLSSMNADDAMKSYAQLAQMHADNTQKLAAAFSTLYGALSDDQKKTADVMFREQHKKHERHERHERHEAMRKHKRAAPGNMASTPAPASKN